MKAVRFFSRVVAVIGLLAATYGEVAKGDILFQDSFSSTGNLVGSSPTTGANWAQTSTATANALQVSNGSLSILTNGQDAWGGFTSPVSNTAGSRLFAGFDINLSAAQGGDYFLHFSDPAGTTTNFYGRVFARASGSGFQLGLASNSGTTAVTTYGTTVLNFSQTYRVVTSWEFVSGTANDVFNVYVDPTDGVQGNNTAYISNYAWTGNAEPAATVAAINIRQGATANAPTLSLDRLIVTRNDFAAASNFAAVPEPASMLLLGVAGIGGFAFRRFRRKSVSETIAS
jgi:uncharacterized protein YaiE (UPF0345 family)